MAHTLAATRLLSAMALVYMAQTTSMIATAMKTPSQAVIGTMGPASFDDYRTTIAIAQRHDARLGLADLVTHRFPLERAEDAIAVARRGEAIKAVVTP